MADNLQGLDNLTLFLLLTDNKMDFIECEECHEQQFAGTKDGYKICHNCLKKEMKQRGHEEHISTLKGLSKLNDGLKFEAVMNLVNMV